MTYEDAIENMARALSDRSPFGLTDGEAKGLATTAAEAIGLREMIEAIKPFVDGYEPLRHDEIPDGYSADYVDNFGAPSVGDVRRLRAAYNKKPAAT